MVSAAAASVLTYETFHGHAFFKASVAAALITLLLLRMRQWTASLMKYYFDRVNMTNLIGDWGGGMSRKKRERVARIIGRR